MFCSRRSREANYLTVLAQWSQLASHLTSYFYDPDLQALEIALSAVASHFHADADPAWLFVLGPSGGDKGSIIVNSCLGATETCHQMGDLTPRTFLSGYTGAPNASLLTQLGSAVLVFKDFTTFLSKREDEQAEIAAQLREIYDGSWKRNTGKGVWLSWVGKMTVIAACTPALERRWSTLGDLGERFLCVRLVRKKGLEQADYAQRQAGLERFISEHMRELAKSLFQGQPPLRFPPPKLSDSQRRIVSMLAELVAHSRGKVPRDKKDEISGISEIENSGRASKELNSLVCGHAALFRRAQVCDSEDLWVARRVAANSIPSLRYLVMSKLAAGLMDKDYLYSVTGLPESTLRRVLGDLDCLGLVHTISGMIERLSLSPDASDLWPALSPEREGPIASMPAQAVSIPPFNPDQSS